MSDIIIFTRQNVRCWYEISYDDEKKAIILRIHEDFISTYRRPERMLDLFKKIYGVDDFFDDFNGNIGYEGIIKFLRKEERFSVFSCALPVMKKLTDEICPKCNGSKMLPDTEIECLECSRTGKKFQYFPKEVSTTIVSLTMLFKLLGYFSLFEKYLPCDASQLAQLLEIKMEARGEDVSAAIGAELSPSMVNWLWNLDNGPLTFVYETMIAANKYMNGGFDRDSLSESDFKRTKVINGRLSIHCPGNATYINTDSRPTKDKGYVMGCHNVDHIYQQLLLLVSLAVLHDRARAEIKSY